MKVRWKFVFGEKHLELEVDREDEDVRLENAVEDGKGMIYVGGDPEAYVNLSMCLAVLRTEEEENQVESESSNNV